MPTKKVTTVEEVDETGPETPSVFDQIIAKGEDSISATDALIDEMRGTDDAVLNVYRDGVGRGKFAFLFALSPEDITARDVYEKCRDEYGGGTYRMHIRDAERIVHNVPFTVEVKKEPEKADAQPPGLGMTEVIAMMTASNDRTAQMFTESMKAMAEAFKGQQNNQPAFDPVAMQASMLQSVAALKQMTEKPDTNEKGAVDMFIQGITLAKDLSPKDGETNSSDILVKALEMFGGPMVEAAKNMPTMMPGLPPPNQPPNLMAPPQPTGDAQVDADAKREYEMGLQKMVLNQQLNFLLRQAQTNKDPELYAELLLDQAGEEKVLAFVGQENAIEQLIALNGEVANHRQWFEALRRAILELTAPDGAGENDDNGAVNAAYNEVVTPPDAISDTDNAGVIADDSGGHGGDTPNA